MESDSGDVMVVYEPGACSYTSVNTWTVGTITVPMVVWICIDSHALDSHDISTPEARVDQNVYLSFKQRENECVGSVHFVRMLHFSCTSNKYYVFIQVPRLVEYVANTDETLPIQIQR